jgi:hypothetical protein
MMSKQPPTATELASLIDLLGSKMGPARQKAREDLVAHGQHATPSVIEALRTSPSNQVRWEAAKALGEIGDARSIPALVDALTDSDPDVAWLAAAALKPFEKAAWPRVLRALIKDETDSLCLRKGAHRVFVHEEEEGVNDLLATLVQALTPYGAPAPAKSAASELLARLTAAP